MPQPTPVPLDQVDLTDLDAFARNEGWAMFDTLRAEDPVLDSGGAAELGLLGGDQVRGHRCSGSGLGDLHVDEVREPRGVDDDHGSPALHA